MCGFLALNRFDKQKRFSDYLDIIEHRGPDSRNEIVYQNWHLGFVRLEIVGDEKYAQPFSSTDHNSILLFNGEVYNYKELAKTHLKGMSLSVSDTEVLYHLLEQHDENIIPLLDGIFSFIFIKPSKNKIIASRDYFGVKPLYYCDHNGFFSFSSELKPLRKFLNSNLDYAGLANHLSFGTNLDEKTIYKNVKSVEPGTTLILDSDGRKQSEKSFCLAIEDKKIDEHLLEKLIRKNIRQQVPQKEFAVMYSGGIDSTLILDTVAQEKNLAHTISVIVNQKDMSEKNWQQYGLNKIFPKKNINIFLQHDQHTFSLENLRKFLSALELPIPHPNYIGSMEICEVAKNKQLKVLLSGEGADELFSGYKWHLSEKSDPFSTITYVPRKFFTEIFGINESQTLELENSKNQKEFFQKYYLRKWLLRADLTGMVNSVEVRVPFLSKEIYEASQNLTDLEKTNNYSIPKAPLKKLVEKRFGSRFAYRKKIGFDYPLNSWITKEYEEYILKNIGVHPARIFSSCNDSAFPDFYYFRFLFVLSSFLIWDNE